jgi:hypothetical protein
MGFQQGGDAPGREDVFPLNLKNCEQVGVIECWGAQATTHDALCFFSRPRARFLLSASLSRARRRVMLVPLVTDLRA